MKLRIPLLNLFKKSEEVQPVGVGTPKAGEMGISGSTLYGTGTFHQYNPDDLMIKKGNRVYREMVKDDQIKPTLQFKINAVLSRDWFFDVETDDTGNPRTDHEDMAAFFTHAVKHIKGSFSDNMIAILSAFQNGFSVTEKVFELIIYEGKTYWGIKDLKLRPFETFNGGFKTDEHGNLLELNQFAGSGKITIPLSKIIHFVHQSDTNRWYGESDLRAAYRSWWSKDIAIRFYNIFLERHASGFIWAQVDGELIGDEKTNLESLLNNISARMAAHVPKKIELKAIQPVRTDAFEKAIALHNRAMARSILVPNLLGLTEEGQTGSYSQSQTQLDAFFWILDIIANRLEETLNEQVFTQLAAWNFGTDDFPRFQFEPISDEQKAEIAKQWGELVGKGAVTKSDSDEGYIRRIMGFPEKSESEEGEEGQEELPLEQPSEEDIDEWIAAQPEEKQEHIRRIFAEKPWFRRVNFTAIKGTLDDQDGKFLDALMESMAEVHTSLEKQIANIVKDRSLGNVQLKEFLGIGISKAIMGKLRRTIRQNLTRVLEDSYELARRELPKKAQAKPIRPGMDKDQVERYLAAKSMTIAGAMEQDTLKAVQQVLENGVKYDKTLNQIIAALMEDTNLMQLLPEVDAAGRAINVPARLENIARTNTADALNQARQALFGQPEFRGFVLAYEYSAILDERTSEYCEIMNGRIRKNWGSGAPPAHFQCRAILIPVTIVDEWDRKESTLPNIQPQKGFY